MFSVETVREIWHDSDGWRIDVGPDRDGLNCVEIRLREPSGEITARMTFMPEAAELVAKAMLALAQELKQSTPAKYPPQRLLNEDNRDR